MAGGTGGHVYPALAVAEQLQDRGINVVWMGTRRGLEHRVVSDTNIELSLIDIKGLRGTGWKRKLQMPFLLLQAMWQSFCVMREKKPDAVLGMGGFVTGPGGVVAWLMRLPLLIHEANAVFGFTNRILARIATRVMTGFRNTEPLIERAIYVGNPLRKEFLQAVDEASGQTHQGANLLVVGGSQGALSFNETVPPAVKLLSAYDLRIWHQCGRGRQHDTLDNYAAAGIDARVSEFIDNMNAAYRWSDFVICRAGAMTVAELQAVARASIFVPYPYAAGDHQTRNAEQLVAAEAALMIRHEQLTPDYLADRLRDLLENPQRVKNMACRMASLSTVDATQKVTDICLEVLHA